MDNFAWNFCRFLNRKIYRESQIAEIPYYLRGCAISRDVIRFSFRKKRWLRIKKLFWIIFVTKDDQKIHLDPPTPLSLKEQDTVWLVPRKESKFKEVQYQKIGRFIAAFGSYIGQIPSKLSILAKNDLKWTKFRHIRIFPVYSVWFSERGPQE